MSGTVDVEGLRRRLEAGVAGPVAFDGPSRALYATDASNYRVLPLGVVLPRSVDDLVATVAVCREQGAPLVLRGGGTSIGGQACGPGVLVDTSRHLGRIEVDPERRVARVEPGAVLDRLREAAAPHGLTFGPDPSTHSRCTLGGMLGNNSCGSHSVAWGTTAGNVESLDALRYDGTRLTAGPGLPGGPLGTALRDLAAEHGDLLRERLPAWSRRVSGYALEHLLPEWGPHLARALVGTEGTCVTVLGAALRLVELPAARALAVLGYPDVVAAAAGAPAALPHAPLTVEGMDAGLLDCLRAHGSPERSLDWPEGGAWLLVEVGGASPGEAAAAARRVAADLERPALVVTEPAAQRAYWQVREHGAGLSTRLPDGGEAWPGWEDAAVPPDGLAAYLRDFQELQARHGRRGVLYGHFGEGCVHVRIDFDLASRAGVAAFRGYMEEAADLVVAHGGSLSGEHGDGRARSELLPRMYGEELVRVFRRFKGIWDPDGRMNPGVLVDPDPVDAHLRVGPDRRVPEPAVTLAYRHDAGSFSRAMRRCMGIGACRRTEGGVMCPSYMVTRDERHSTRGRAHLLFEMLQGEAVPGGWRSPAVRDALDLCLACKGCKRDCPVQVDMAAYKAEFLHQHYRRRLRPASHYSMGWLPLWLRLGALAPGLANRAGRVPLLKRLAGVAPRRPVPALAAEPFTRWFRRRGGSRSGGRPVLLWPDTFGNFLSPEVPRAATEVLEAAGFRVTLPPRGLCCGLPWVSTGQLGVAKRVARRTVAALAPTVDASVPVVGLEPSCTATLRDDLPELLDGDERASGVAAATLTLAELLEREAPDWSPAPLARPSVAQVHCHQHAVLGFDPDERLLRRLGLDHRTLDTGCCGLAGNFGYEAPHYDLSIACAERALLPELRAATPETLVLADGWSCRTQITHTSSRQPLHLAQVLQLALRGGASARTAVRPPGRA